VPGELAVVGVGPAVVGVGPAVVGVGPAVVGVGAEVVVGVGPGVGVVPTQLPAVQTMLEPLQSEELVQPWQEPVDILHFGVLPEQPVRDPVITQA